MFLLGVLVAAAIPERLARAAAHKALHRRFLDLDEGGIHGVRQKEHLEAGLGVEVLQRVPHRLCGGDYLGGLLLVEGDDDGGLRIPGWQLCSRRRDAGRGQEHDRACDAGECGDAKIGEVDREQTDRQPFEIVQPAGGEARQHCLGREKGGGQRTGENDEEAPLAVAFRRGAAATGDKRLGRHVEALFGRPARKASVRGDVTGPDSAARTEVFERLVGDALQRTPLDLY